MKVLLRLTTLVVLAGPVAAQAVTHSLVVTKDASGKLGVTSTTNDGVTLEKPVTLSVTCDPGVDCTKVSARVTGPNGPTGRDEKGTAAGLSKLVPQSDTGEFRFDLFFEGLPNPIHSLTLRGRKAGGQQATPPAAAAAGTLALLTTPCTGSAQASYERKNDLARIVVTPTGRVIASHLEAFDEDDSLEVTILAHPDLAPRLGARRVTPFRDRTQVYIIGEGEEAVGKELHAGEEVPCLPVVVKLGDFAPGRAEVQITLLDEKGESKAAGSFEFHVGHLYSGIFSLGGAWSSLVDPDFDVAGTGSSRVVTVKNQGKRDFHYSVFFTPFILGKRDVEKTWRWYSARDERYPWWQHINPSVGLVLNDVSENALVGVTVDLPVGFLFTYGYHFGRVGVLDRNSNLEEGSPYSGKVEDLPTAESWENDKFIAVSVDLRAAVKLFKVVGKGAGS